MMAGAVQHFHPNSHAHLRSRSHSLTCNFFLGRKFSVSLPLRWHRGMSRRCACANAKQQSSDGRSGGKPRLDAVDMMELEFGRLLGEDREITMRKVIGKKLNPEVPYLQLEKQKELTTLGAPGKPSALSKQQSSQGNGSFGKELQSPPRRIVTAEDEGVPQLTSPPLRPKGAAEQNTLPSRPVRAVPPVKFGGGKLSQGADPVDYKGLVQKPLRTRPSEVGLPPVLAARDVIPPMSMKKKLDLAPESKQTSSIDGLVRRPAILDPAINDVASVRPEASATLVTEDLQVRDDVDVREDKGEPQLKGEGVAQASRSGTTGTMPTTDSLLLSKPTLPTLDSKPAVFLKPFKPVNEERSLQETLESRETEADTDTVDSVAGTNASPLGSASKSLPRVLKPSYELRQRFQKSPASGEDSQDDIKEITVPVMQSQDVESSESLEKDDLTTLKETAAIRGRLSSVVKPLYVAPVVDGVTESISGNSVIASSLIASNASVTKPSNIDSNQNSYPKSKSPPLSEPSIVVDNSTKEVCISLEEMEGDIKEQLLSPLLALSQEIDKRKSSSTRLSSDEPATIKDKASPMDSTRRVLKLHRVSPMSKPATTSVLDKGEAESPTSEISGTALPLSPILEQSSRHSDQTPKRDSNSYNLETPKLTRQQFKSAIVDDNQTGNVKDTGREVENASVSQDNEAISDTGKATQVQDHNNQQQHTKNMILSRPSPSPALSRRPLPISLADTEPALLSASLQSTLRKSIKIRDEREVTVNKEEEDQDWARAEALHDSKTLEEVSIIGSTKGGLLASFGSLVGYLPAFELAAKKRPQSYVAWAQSKGIDVNRKEPDQEIQEERTVSALTQDAGSQNDILQQKSTNDAGSNLLDVYREERAKYLSLLGEEKVNMKVIVTAVDRTLRQLRFSEKQAEGEDQEQEKRKAQLMERLNVGDVVTCKVTKISTFGAFVELEGISALIHVSELSWNRNADSLSVIKIGEELEVKVCNLDYFQQRINLSLKQMQPDPLVETLESLVSQDAVTGLSSTDSPDELKTEAAESPELQIILSRLAATPGISGVVNGRRVRGSALAPTFQVYLSVPLDGGYKLLARFGNEVQEVLVETSMDRDQMKQVIQDCMVQGT